MPARKRKCRNSITTQMRCQHFFKKTFKTFGRILKDLDQRNGEQKVTNNDIGNQVEREHDKRANNVLAFVGLANTGLFEAFSVAQKRAHKKHDSYDTGQHHDAEDNPN